mmetsp:Transcript_28692/g.89219  ORF Transcript_28692/g.89219 Transcript_28692/m.89219 type:complete len:478 (+) Transcript_28692:632-2065(+)
MLVVPQRVVRDRRAAWAKGCAPKAACINGQELCIDGAAPVAVRKDADMLLGLHELVYLHVSDESQALHDVAHVVQDRAVGQHRTTGLEPLHLRLDHLNLLEVDPQEEDVPRAPPRVLPQEHARLVLVDDHRWHLEHVPANELVDRLHHCKDNRTRWRVDALVHKPTDTSRQEYVQVPHDQVDLSRPELDRRADVLIGKGTAPDDDHVLVCQRFEIKQVAVGVLKLPLIVVLARPVGLARADHGSWIEADVGHGQLPAVVAALLRGAPEQVVASLDKVGVILHRHLEGVRVELHVGSDSVLVARILEVLQDLCGGGPAPVVWLQGCRTFDRVIGELVVHALRLRAGRVVGQCGPRMTAKTAFAVHQDEVDLVPCVVHGLPQAVVPGANDAVRMRIPLLWLRERLQVPDDDVRPDLVGVAEPPHRHPHLRQELNAVSGAGAEAEHLGQDTSQVLHLRGDHNWHPQLFPGLLDLQGYILP